MRPDIQAAADRIQSKLGIGKELKTLDAELWEGEQVARIVGGTYGKGNGIVVLTDRRVLFYFRGVVSAQTEDFPLDKISSIDFKSGLLLGEITVYVSSQKATIKNVEKEGGKLLVDEARAAISHHAAPSAASTSAADQLLKLKQLHDAGVLSADEYEAKRAPLIAQL